MSGFRQNILCLIGLVFWSFCVGATECYLRIDDIDGDVAVAGYKNWIALEALSFGSADPESVVFRHALDKATPKLQRAAICGMDCPLIELHLRYSEDMKFVTRFRNVKFVSADVSSEHDSNGGVRLVEEVRFRAETINTELYVEVPSDAQVQKWIFGTKDKATIVVALWYQGTLSFSGSGEVVGLADDAPPPWSDLPVTNVVIGANVKPTANFFRGLNEDTLVNGSVPVLLMRRLAGEQLIQKSIGEAEAIGVENGRIHLKVAASMATELGSDEWVPVKVEQAEKDKDGKIRLIIPVTTPQGFYRLKTK